MTESSAMQRVEPATDPELLGELMDLDEDEQHLLKRMILQAKYKDGERVKMTDVTMVNEFLKLDPEYDDLSVFRNISVYTAPQVIKEYSDKTEIALKHELIPIKHSLAEVLKRRVSRRDFSKGPMSLQELTSLLHYAYGVRKQHIAYNVKGFPIRFVPTTGGLQAVEIYLVANAVDGVEQGLYHFNAAKHALEEVDRGNMRRRVVQCAVYQEWLDAASAVFFLTCDMRKVYWKYGRRAYRFVHVDLGIIAQTMQLVATSLGLRSCMVAGYQDNQVNDLLQIDGRDEFIGLMFAVGRKPWQAGPAEPTAPEAPAAAVADPKAE